MTARVIVIGGGIGGLASAIALKRAGLDAEVYERAPGLRDIGAGLSLWRNALVALDRIGVGAAVRRFSAPYAGAGLRMPDGRVLVAPAMDRLQARVGEVGLVLHRAMLQAILADALGREHIHLGRTCAAIDQDANGVSAVFADGSRASGDALVGADGLHSVVRASLFGPAPATYAGYTAWRGVVPFDHAQLTMGESWGNGRRFGQVAMARGEVYWFATKNAPPGETAPDSEKAELLRLFKGWHRPIEALIEATPEDAVLRNDIFDRPPLAAWSRGRVTLLGDAAHAMTPNLGQGGCQALEDAVVLARAMRDATSVEAAWRAYESARIPRTRAITIASRRVGRLAQAEHPVAVGLRNALVKLLGPLQVRQIAGVIGYDVG